MTTNLKADGLKAQEIENYKEQGFLIPNFQFTKEEVRLMQSGLDDVIENSPGVRPEQLLGVHLKNGYGNELKGNQVFFDMANHPKLLDIIESILGEDIIFWGSQVICKKATDGYAVPWHQDGEYWPIKPLAALTAWIALEDSTVENGCMKVIPGSHKAKKLLKHSVSGKEDIALNQALDKEEYDESKAINVELKAGQLSFHDAYLVHGSTPNTSHKRRAGFIPRYMPASSHYVRENIKSDQLGKGLATNANYSGRPIWLARGKDTSGLNNFSVGQELK